MGISPITAAEFSAAIQKLWRPHVPTRGPFAKARIGLCVSGGPDSMALAYLCSRLRHEGIAPELDATAFIVDHRIRPESTDEAHTVSRWLNDYGITSEILTMEWPTERLGGGLTGGFETEARSRRYRLIAEACQRRGLMSVFLGHHADDQVETVLMRMVYNLGSFVGLQGIAAVKPMPCIEGIYGADPRGPPLPVHRPRDRAKYTLPHWRKQPMEDLSMQKWLEDLSKPLLQNVSPSKESQKRFLNAYGILMFRPFLDYVKSRLVATCEANEVPFVTDPTNEDPAATARNTCRHLNSHYKLPRALQRESILQLAENARSYEEDISEKSASVLKKADIGFDVRSGVLDIRFPRSIYPSIDVMAHTLQSVVDVVNPLKPDHPRARGALFQMARIASTMFPQLKKTQMELPKPEGPPFNVDHIKIAKFEVNKSGSPHLSGIAWQLSRVVPMSEEQNILTPFAQQSLGYRAHGGPVNSEWVLWDGRYWIKIFGVPFEDIGGWHVRFIRQDDLAQIRTNFRALIGARGIKQFESLLSSAAPGKLRLTLPVIVDNKRRLRFLPSLGVTIPGPYRRRSSTGEVDHDDIRYVIKYKAIDPLLLSKLKLATSETADEKKAAKLKEIKERAMSLWPVHKETRDTEEQTKVDEVQW